MPSKRPPRKPLKVMPPKPEITWSSVLKSAGTAERPNADWHTLTELSDMSGIPSTTVRRRLLVLIKDGRVQTMQCTVTPPSGPRYRATLYHLPGGING